MRIGEYEVQQDNETVVVNKVSIAKSGKHKGEEVLTPVAYVRSLRDAVRSIMRKMSASALSKADSMIDLVSVLDKQHDEVLAAIDKVKTFPRKKDLK